MGKEGKEKKRIGKTLEKTKGKGRERRKWPSRKG